MRKRKGISFISALLIIISALPLTAKAAEGQMLTNGDLSGDGVPEGWTVQSYLPQDYSVTAECGVVTLNANACVPVLVPLYAG